MAEIKPLSAELQKIAIDELGEVPSRIPEDLQALKLWIKQQPHLRARTDDQFLIQFLRGCKYSLERAKEKLDLYTSLKSKYPEMLNATNLDDARFRHISSLGCFLPLPTPVHGNGPRNIVFQFNYSASEYNIDDIFLVGSAMHEVLINSDPYACIQGINYITDFGKATTSHYLQLTPNFCKRLVSFVEKSMPLRIKGIYFINTSTPAQQFFKILLPLFSEKLRQRIHIMGTDFDRLLKDIPLKYLPRDYDGAQPSMVEVAAEYAKVWDANREYFKENAQYGTDEKLRPGQPLDLDGLFGVGGSFRKLITD